MFNIKSIAFVLLFLATFSISNYSQISSTLPQKDVKADYTKDVAKATPKSLPQIPVADKLKSDAEDDNLKGKVKSLVEEREGLTGIEKPIGKRLSLIAHFNENGNFLREVYFEYRGIPYQVTVYGYIDGARASISDPIKYGNVSDAVVMTKPKKQEKTIKPDLRYEYKYEYKYVNGKLAEMQMLHNDGSKGMRYVYNYNGNRMEKLAYTTDNELNSKYLYIFDEKGNEIGRIDYNVRQPQIPEEGKWEYQNVIFDEKGNWTKRTFSKLEIENGKEVYKPIAVEYRTITYYP